MAKIIPWDIIDYSWYPLFGPNRDLIYRILEKMDQFPEGTIYPPTLKEIFRVFSLPVREVEIVIVGQDCYHQKGQANGLCFAVNEDVKIPPSLKNIFKELKNEFPDREYSFTHGDLSRWFVEEKMFLMNSALTVCDSRPGSFMKDWEPFTDRVIQYLQKENSRCIFLLLGNYAIGKSEFIEDKHRIVTGVHPSPLSANRGFFGSGVFQQVEEKLGREIDWQN
jgi:uracil-DNA glycosylase